MLTDEAPGHFAQCDGGNAFLCVERKGSEAYSSCDELLFTHHLDKHIFEFLRVHFDLDNGWMQLPRRP
jgi:hypothetical protein